MWNKSIIDGPLQIPIFGDPQPVTLLKGEKDVGDTFCPVTGYREGYHLNMPADAVPEAAKPYLVDPAEPARVLAGTDTAFLKFPDEATARTVLAEFWSA